MSRKWCLMDLVVGQDGKLVMTKVQACSFHLALFSTVVFITFIKREFVDAMWSLYAMVAVGHAVIDKTTAAVAGYKNRQLDLAAEPAGDSTSVTTTVQTKTSA